jgi:hypothetical protein
LRSNLKSSLSLGCDPIIFLFLFSILNGYARADNEKEKLVVFIVFSFFVSFDMQFGRGCYVVSMYVYMAV